MGGTNHLRAALAVALLVALLAVPVPGAAAAKRARLVGVTHLPSSNISITTELAEAGDGSVWFGTVHVNNGRWGVARITRGGGFREFLLPRGTEASLEVATGPDGAVWFTGTRETKSGGESVLLRATESGPEVVYATARGLRGLVSRRGVELRAAEGSTGAVTVDRSGAVKSAAPWPGGFYTAAVFSAARSEYWSVAPRFVVRRIATDGSLAATYRVEKRFCKGTPRSDRERGGHVCGPHRLAAATDGALWLSNSPIAPPRVARVTRGGSIRVVNLIEERHTFHVQDIAAAPRGGLWAAEGEFVSRIDKRGVVTKYRVRGERDRAVTTLLRARDGTIWFAGGGGNSAEVGRLGGG